MDLKYLNKNKISIIIPFFNCEKFLAESIESVLNQTHTNWELILVNDGSDDKSIEIAINFIDKQPSKISLYSHKNNENFGASSSRNLGINQAIGDFITFLDADDVFLPNTLELGIKAFKEKTEVDVVCGNLQYWFSWTDNRKKNERDFVVNFGLELEKIYEPPSLLVHNLRAGGRKPGIGCIILREEFAKKSTLFEDGFKYVSEDQLFWTRVSLNARIYLVDDVFAKYRQHHGSSTSVLKESGKTLEDMKMFLNWLEAYLVEQKIEHHEIDEALHTYKKELKQREKYQKVFDIYRNLLPYNLRYWIRDLIIKWRMYKNSK